MDKELKDKLPSLKSMAYDRDRIKKNFDRAKGKKTTIGEISIAFSK